MSFQPLLNNGSLKIKNYELNKIIKNYFFVHPGNLKDFDQSQIKTNLKESIAAIIFSNLEINKKRIEIRKLRQKGLSSVFIRMFIKLLEYVSEI